MALAAQKLSGFIKFNLIYKTILAVKKMTALMTQTTGQTKSSTILQRIAEKDKTAVVDCVDAYGNFIWALARKFTNSTEEAEAAAQEIFIDIWRYAEYGDQTQSVEKLLIALIARQRLVRFLQLKPNKKSMAGIDNQERARGRKDRISESF